jgi:mRNA interferase HigB
MRVLGRKVLIALSDRHADCRDWVTNWLDDVSESTWRSPQDIKGRYSTASFLANNVVIFNVRGNRYRLEVMVAYQAETVLVKWCGTHAEYMQRHK